ncbi:DMT family transporter [Streptomyces sp. 6N223]|uniref:DMT family transporter n=1 Tax=Streptomyces sp. 6N223 TaxID=3457412 RepID=UPI003FD27AFB
MRPKDSAIAASPIAVPGRVRPTPSARGGLVLAALGVTAFSLTFPATAWALEGLGPWTATCARLVLAALVAGCCLAAARARPPGRRHWAGLVTVATGVVIGFPLLTTLALTTSTTSHAAVVTGLLPLTTACYAALRTGVRPPPLFWAAAVAGAAVVATFTVAESGGPPTTGDAYLFAALLVCAAAYGEGARLAAVMPGWQVISWALVLCLPLSLPGLGAALLAEPADLTTRSAAGLLWVAVGSQLLGLVVWYRGLARAGTARASQLQLAQPLLTLAWSAALLGEDLTPATAVAALAVVACITATQRAGAPRRPPGRRLEDT